MAARLRVSPDPCIVVNAVLLRTDPDRVDREHTKAQVLADMNKALERFRNPGRLTARIQVATTTKAIRDTATANARLLD